MTGPDNGNATRPISVAELLAKNGTIGAPVSGGRRRRRRGNSDAVTVAELTGEIPIVRTGELPVVTDDEATATAPEETAEQTTSDELPEPVAAEPAAPEAEAEAPAAPAEPEAEPEPERRRPLRRADTPLPRRGRSGAPERTHHPRPVRKNDQPRRPVRRPAGAELMSPDPIDLDAPISEPLDLGLGGSADLDDTVVPDELGLGEASYLRSADDTLFGGETVADDLARRGDVDADSDLLTEEDEAAEALSDEEPEPLTRVQKVWHGTLVLLQCLLAVGFGAGLFLAFVQLWQWQRIVALVLGGLVVVALVVGVRIVRKTEDIGSTLIAIAVGLIVTFGPLALQQAN